MIHTVGRLWGVIYAIVMTRLKLRLGLGEALLGGSIGDEEVLASRDGKRSWTGLGDVGCLLGA